jgi:Pyruvate/2-oxoacid:ferredoxin oxidoreductase delta subunit
MHGIQEPPVKNSWMSTFAISRKKEHYFEYHKGHNCGICSAVCPYGLKVLKKKSDKAYHKGNLANGN